MPTPRQTKAAIALAGKSRKDLADAAKVAERTITDFVRKSRTPNPATMAAISRGIWDLGVELLPDEGVRPREEGA